MCICWAWECIAGMCCGDDEPATQEWTAQPDVGMDNIAVQPDIGIPPNMDYNSGWAAQPDIGMDGAWAGDAAQPGIGIDGGYNPGFAGVEQPGIGIEQPNQQPPWGVGAQQPTYQ